MIRKIIEVFKQLALPEAEIILLLVILVFMVFHLSVILGVVFH